MTSNGCVILVGAGPGDPDLLTIKALKALQSADVVLFDNLVSPAILDLIKRETKRLLVGKKGYGPSMKQSEINDLAIKLAREGKRVIRLKGGDPMIFGRAGEEIEACRRAGIPVEVVPGITTAQGVAAAHALSLTHREQARRLQFITAHDKNGGLPPDLDWRAIADPGATSVVYMARRTLRLLVEKAVAAGLDPKTPAMAVANATRPDEIVLEASIEQLADVLDTADPDGPVIVLIGRALNHRQSNAIRHPSDAATG